MSSTNFTYGDAVGAARESLQDAAQRRWPDATIFTYVLPRVLQQLRSDRPDLFIGTFGSENFKPTDEDVLPDDMGFNTLVEAIVAAILKQEEESAGSGSAAAADFTSERSRKS